MLSLRAEYVGSVLSFCCSALRLVPLFDKQSPKRIARLGLTFELASEHALDFCCYIACSAAGDCASGGLCGAGCAAAAEAREQGANALHQRAGGPGPAQERHGGAFMRTHDPAAKLN